jgi:hypothetical protein
MEFETKKQRNNYFRSVNTIINGGPAARPEWAKVPITFTEEDFKLKSAHHNDAMVIEVNIAGWVIRKILVDNGSSADILFFKTFEKMNLSQHMLQPPEYPLQGFGGKPIKPVGKVSLPESYGDLDIEHRLISWGAGRGPEQGQRRSDRRRERRQEGRGDAHLEVDECEGEGLERVIVALEGAQPRPDSEQRRCRCGIWSRH